MKKLLTIFMFTLVFAIGFQASNAATGDIELYPYDEEACLNAEPECTSTKVGDSHWSVSFNGSNYHVVSANTRYVSEWDDEDFSGDFTPTEFPVLGWGSFGAITFNNTLDDIILNTAGNRADLTSNAQYQQVYFDENGDVVMFEDSVYTYYIFNDGDLVTPDWRLATAEEITAYDAADPKPDTTRLTHVRIKVDAQSGAKLHRGLQRFHGQLHQ